MSRDFELLRKAELGRKSTARVPRREISPEFARLPEPIEFQPSVGPAEQARTRESDWVKALAVVRRRWRLAASFAAITLGAVALIVFWIRPEYEPSARLEIDPPGSETFSMQAIGTSLSETQYLETQAQNLQTDDLAVAVIRKLRLDKNSDFAAKVPAASAPAHSLSLLLNAP